MISTVGLVVCGASLDQCTKIVLQVCIKCVCANIHSRKHVKWRGWDTSVFVQVKNSGVCSDRDWCLSLAICSAVSLSV